jgi:hypothetical protein
VTESVKQTRRSFLRRLAGAALAVSLGFVAVCKAVGSNWSWPGSLPAHLLYFHRVPVQYVQGQPMGALIELHNAVHEGRFNPRPRRPYRFFRRW